MPDERIQTSLRDIPMPGSEGARKGNCICPVIDNGYGKGYFGGVKDKESGATVYAVVLGCPMHTQEWSDFHYVR